MRFDKAIGYGFSCAVMLLVACSPYAAAAGATPTVVAFNNFGANGTYANYGTWMGLGPGSTMYSAQSFTLSTSGQLDSIRAAMYRVDPATTDRVTLSIIGETPGGVPATDVVYWSETFVGHLPVGYGTTAFFNVTGGPSLDAGKRYWLYADVPAESDYAYDWYDGLSGLNATAWYFAADDYGRAGQWQVFQPSQSRAGRAMTVTLQVPEPASAALVAAAGLVVATVGRRRQPRR